MTSLVCSNNTFVALGNQNVLTVKAGDNTYFFNYPEVERCFDGLRLKNVDAVVDQIYQNENVKPIDAKMKFTPCAVKRFEIIREVCGRELDKEKLKSDLLDTLMMGGGIVRASFKIIKPKLTAKELMKATNERARFTTYFSHNQDRITNIIRASSFINGITVQSGEVFSFNETVGERTKQRGFKMAKIIVNGEYAEGVGGGVCQVSTTLYNASLLSGLEIVEHHQHSLAVSYVEPSFDAMVNSGSSDLRFKNNTDLPIFIETEVGENSISFRIFGEKNPYEYKRSSVIMETINAKTEFIQTDLLGFGEEKLVKNPINGCISEGFLTAFKNGKQVWTKKIRQDRYLAVNGLMEVNNVRK